mgnify:CR=1 FL=1
MSGDCSSIIDKNMLARNELKSGYSIIDINTGMGGSIHQLYVKEHTGKDSLGESTTNGGCTLFVGNVDLTLEMSHQDIDGYLREMMEQFGQIDAVYISALSINKNRKRNRTDDQVDESSDDDDDDENNNNNTGIEDSTNITSNRSRFAHVIFNKKSDLKLLLKSIKKGGGSSLGSGSSIAKDIGIKYGMSNNSNNNSISGSMIRKLYPLRCEFTPDELKADVNESMNEFEENERILLAKQKSLENSIDSDGFTLVKNRNKRKKSNNNDNDKNKGRKRSKKNKGTEELKNFYRYQLREEKKDILLSLREKFAQDQKKIADLKAQRKFKPF